MSENPYQSPSPYQSTASASRSDLKEPHGCVVAWLLLMILGYVIGLPIYLASGVYDVVTGAPFHPSLLQWSLRPVLETIFFVCVVALWKFKRAGFYGCAVIWLIVAMQHYFLGNEWSIVVTPCVYIVLLFGLLQLGRPSTWSQLD